MTKAQELQILDKAIQQLGPDSYLGPWLTEVRAEVAASITSDIVPVVTLAAARQTAGALLEEAANKTLDILNAAQRDAKRIREAAESTAQHDLKTALACVQRAERELSRAAGVL